MKIKITESQYSKIKLLSEQEEYLQRFKSFCAEKAKEVEDIYTMIINKSIDDVMRMAFNAEAINSTLDKVERAVLNAETNMNNLYDQGLINGENLDIEIMNIADVVKDKITALSLLLTPLEKLQEYENQRNLSGKFNV
jgi:hypothetical protein